MALYEPRTGFYAVGEGAGRSGHFLTSPEVGPLFGAVLAQAIDGWWRDLGSPDPFVVVEAGAGAGSLADAVLTAAPACAPALLYVLVERSESLRQRQAATLPLTPPAGPRGGPERPSERGDGPWLASVHDLPSGPVTGVVLANELLDNLPFILLDRGEGRWFEVRVGEAEGREAGLAEVLVAAPYDLADLADRLTPAAPTGARIPVQNQAAGWLRDALRLLDRGRVVAIDYASTTPELVRRPPGQWLRTYRRGGPGRGPLHQPGTQDITCEVCVDQLAQVRSPDANRAQADFLAAHGLARLVEEARRAWEAGAAAGGLGALRARSRMDEAAALTDAGGLGAFRVLEWEVG